MGNRKQMMDIDKKSTMTSALSDEHQRNWNDEQLHRKIEATERNYDLSRMPLNFEISHGGKIEAIDKRKNIADKIEDRIKEGVTVQTSIRSTSHRSVNIVFGGNRERMLEMAFGKQQIGERGKNWNVHRCPEIEQWAKDIYDFSCHEFGEKNIVSFIVHCDELNPHAHCVVVPILPDGRLCCKEMFGGKTLPEAKARISNLHDRLAIVNANWGLDRGDEIEETGAKHISLNEHHRQLSVDNQRLDAEINVKKEVSKDLDTRIAQKEKAIKSLTTMCQNYYTKIENCKEQLIELETRKQQGQIKLADYQCMKENLRKQICGYETKIDEKQKFINEKQTELTRLQKEVEGLNAGTKAYSMLKFTHSIPQIKEIPPKMFGQEYWLKRINGWLETKFLEEMKKVETAYHNNAQNVIDKFRNKQLVDYNELNNSRSIINELRENISHLVNLNNDISSEAHNFINMMSYPQIREDVIAVAEALMGGKPVPSIGGGGGSSSDLRWDGRNPDEDEHDYRIRCMLTASRFVRPKYYRVQGRTR